MDIIIHIHFYVKFSLGSFNSFSSGNVAIQKKSRDLKALTEATK